MRPEIITDAIVVKSMDYKESDRLYTLFTRSSGMITTSGTSVRKPLSKLAGHMAVPGVVRVFLVAGRQFYRLAGASLQEPFGNFLDMESGMMVYANLRRLLSLAHPEPQQDKPIFDSLIAICRGLNQLKTLQQPLKLQLWVHVFALRLLAHSGYHPIINACFRCQRTDRPLIAFSIEHGGGLCPLCGPAFSSAISVSNRLIAFLQAVLRSPEKTDQPLSLPECEIQRFSALVGRLLNYYFSPRTEFKPKIPIH